MRYADPLAQAEIDRLTTENARLRAELAERSGTMPDDLDRNPWIRDEDKATIRQQHEFWRRLWTT